MSWIQILGLKKVKTIQANFAKQNNFSNKQTVKFSKCGK